MNTVLPLHPAPTTPRPSDERVMPLALRVVRAVALLGFSFILSLLIGLALFASISAFHEPFRGLVSWFGEHNLTLPAVYITILVAVVTTVLIVMAKRLKLRAGRWLIGGYLAAAPVLAYLATDDATFRFPVTIDELSPAFPGAEESFAVFMRYGKQHPLGMSFKTATPAVAAKRPKDTAEWLKLVTENRASLEKQWIELAPVWSWWQELNTFDRIGDLTPAALDAELISFAPCRTLSQVACGVATLRALDGKGDEALDILIPLLQVSRKLQPSGRTLVRLMIAIVIERLAMETATVVLDQAAISPAHRDRLAASLQPGNIEAAARRLILVDYVMSLGSSVNADWKIGDILAITGSEHSWIARPMNLLSPFVYNPHATFNLYGEYIRDIAELLARRELKQRDAREARFFQVETRPRFKNFLGAMFAQQLVPALEKVSIAFWETQDLRATLLAKVKTP